MKKSDSNETNESKFKSLLKVSQASRENISENELGEEATEEKPIIDEEKLEERQSEPEAITPTEPSKSLNPQPKLTEETTTTQAPQTDTPKQMGRPKVGKRSNNNFKQVTAYIENATYKKVKFALAQLEDEGQKLEFSELVQELLESWLEARR